MKILAAEDNPIFQSMLRNMLTKWGYEVVMARDGNEALSLLKSEDAPRLALLDWMMPGMDGVEVCRRVRLAGSEPYVYMVLLTARTDSQDLLEAMDAGADDYLTKPFQALELRARLRAGRRIIELQQELLQTREALRQQATHDALTGVFNRAAILHIVHKELLRARREGLDVGLLMVDLDRFKEINDSLGHPAGDAVLREAAHRMLSGVRRYDSIGRYGGDEFLVVLPGCGQESARVQAERLRQALSTDLFPVNEQALPVTCSVGCATLFGAGSSDADSLIRAADASLYKAKQQGRNRTELADPEPAKEAAQATGPHESLDLTNSQTAVVT
jgi:two-component system, cell cycle response regulator